MGFCACDKIPMLPPTCKHAFSSTPLLSEPTFPFLHNLFFPPPKPSFYIFYNLALCLHSYLSHYTNTIVFDSSFALYNGQRGYVYHTRSGPPPWLDLPARPEFLGSCAIIITKLYTLSTPATNISCFAENLAHSYIHSPPRTACLCPFSERHSLHQRLVALPHPSHKLPLDLQSTIMEVRNSTGRTVSLLNDDSTRSHASHSQIKAPHTTFPQTSRFAYAHNVPRSGSASPNTPELLRSSSYDSQMSNDPLSPITPPVDYGYSRYYQDQVHDGSNALKRPSEADSRRTSSYDDDHSMLAQSDRPAKRYPCRFRDSHGCEKTFTTSGHASRHSKIHTAEKAVQCTFAGCQKKFTRADNMKQHLETHYKDKTRSGGHRKVAMADSRRQSASVRSRSSTASHDHLAMARQDLENHTQYPLPSPALPSPSTIVPPGGSWDSRLPMHSRPVTTRSPNSGLDALAMAVAQAESGQQA